MATKDQVLDELQNLFISKPETLTRIWYYLDEEEKAYKDGTDLPPVWYTLKRALNASKQSFKLYAERLAEDTKKGEKDLEYAKFMNFFYKQIATPSDQPLSEDAHQGWQIVLRNEDVIRGAGGFARAWTRVPPAAQKRMIEALANVVYNKQSLVLLEKAGTMANKVGGTVVMVGLAAVQLAYEAIISIKKWWNGEITGVRCTKNIVDSLASVSGGVAGGFAGAGIGALAGPVGMVVGGLAGGIVGSKVAEWLSDRLTQYLFGIPKEAALENAYRFFDVKMTASNNEINTSFKKLCLKHHPDKGGSEERFIEVQANLAVIKAARNELGA